MSSYEEQILKILKENKVDLVREKTFKDLKHGLFRFDFYLTNFRGEPLIIEVDGEYHFKPIRGRQALLKQQEHDRQKNSYCLAHKIPLYRIPYWDLPKIKTLDDILSKKYRVTSKWWNDEIYANHVKNV